MNLESSGKDSRSHSRTNSSSNASSALRPRGKRLVPGIDDPALDNSLNTALAIHHAGVFDSPFQSRTASPIPSKHPSRASSSNPAQRHTHSSSGDFRYSDNISSVTGNDLAASLSGFWGKSWTSLQGLASNVLGSDASQETIKDKTPQRQRRPLEATHSQQWGPPGQDSRKLLTGTKEERKVLVRAKKREDLLTGNTYLHPDTVAHYKRRKSDDFLSVSTLPGDHDDRDALVYIHHVKLQDTLAGISIKFNCQLAAIKKANRMWSNDGVQARKTIVIPVDTCGVKGRPVFGPVENEGDLIGGDSAHDDEATPTLTSPNNPWLPTRRGSSSTIRQSPAPSPGNSELPSPPSTKSTDEPPWKHDSWVLLEGHPCAIEIARLPRRDLGFFPRARRKSNSYSDLDTPSDSLDLPRPSITISDTSASSRSVQHKSRRSSSSHKFAQKMTGPGGVGSLVGKGPSAPGPAGDKLNKVFAKHLPNVAPPDQSPFEDDDGVGMSLSSTNTINLENVGGAIEGWVRKLANTAAKAVEPTLAVPQLGKGVGRGVGLGPGDLIELNDAFELGDDEDMPEVQRGRAGGTHSKSMLGESLGTLKAKLPVVASSPSRFDEWNNKKKGD